MKNDFWNSRLAHEDLALAAHWAQLRRASDAARQTTHDARRAAPLHRLRTLWSSRRAAGDAKLPARCAA